MAKHGKKFREAAKLVDSSKKYTLDEAMEILPQTVFTKFTPSVELCVKTNANPKYNDQMIRSTTVLPHGTGKTVKIAVFTTEDKASDAKKAGADIVGHEDLLAKIQKGEMDFDVLITTPDMIRDLAKVAKVLGPRGLMPSPKAGTVTPNLAQAVEEVKKGKIEFRLDKTGNIHAVVGKSSFSKEQLKENIESLLNAIHANRPTGVKGKLVKKVVVTTTMGPGIVLDVQN